MSWLSRSFPFLAELWKRDVLDEATREQIFAAERDKIAAWAKGRGLDGNNLASFRGVIGRLELTVEIRRSAEGLPRGVEIIVKEPGLTEKRLVELLDDVALEGSLRTVAAGPESVTLSFHPMRATEVYDSALAALEEILTRDSAPPVPPEADGPYR